MGSGSNPLSPMLINALTFVLFFYSPLVLGVGLHLYCAISSRFVRKEGSIRGGLLKTFPAWLVFLWATLVSLHTIAHFVGAYNYPPTPEAVIWNVLRLATRAVLALSLVVVSIALARILGHSTETKPAISLGIVTALAAVFVDILLVLLVGLIQW